MRSTVLNRPLWLEGAETDFPSLAGNLTVDVAVIGAGITGTTIAYLLKQAGQKVALLEANRVSYGATGYTTAKLTVGHGLAYSSLVDSFGEDTAHRYAQSNRQAIEQVAAIVAEHGIDCDFETASNYVYAESESGRKDIEREAEAAQAAGIAATLTTDTDLPYPIAAAVRVDDQAQFHPWKYVAGLARLVDGDGSYVLEMTRATDVRCGESGETCEIETGTGRVRARHVVVATQMPFLHRGLFFAMAHPVKSYAVAARIAAERAPRGMYISAEPPTRSVRSTSGPDGQRVVIVGGEGHKPGTDPNTAERYDRLESFMTERFGVSGAEWRWSTHDYAPLDQLPYIGRLRRGSDRILVATGFAKWGMTKGTLAARILADTILGRENEYAGLYASKRLDVRRSAPSFLKENGQVGVRFFRDRVRPREGRAEIAGLAPGEGTVARVGRKHIAAFRDDAGRLHMLSARCTHLGCIVGWNPADRAWECPCHGSRFTAVGQLVQGPATSDLPPEPLP